MAFGRCQKCGQWAGEDHECPDFIKNAPTPQAERDNDTRWTEDDDGAVASLKAKRILTLDDLIEACDIDLTKWVIERHVINKWEVGAKNNMGVIEVEPLFQVKAWLKPLEKFKDILEEMEKARANMERFVPHTFVVPRYAKDNDLLAEISMPDTHFGLYVWGDETGGRNYDLGIAEEAYGDSMSTLLSRVGANVGSYLYVVGNDGLHADQPGLDGKGGATTRGTNQDTDGRLPKVFRKKHEIIISSALTMAKTAPVKIVVVSGNHDYYSSFYIGEVVRMFFKNHPSITVDNSPKQRKYHRHGSTLLGFTHGDKEKPDELPLLMAQEQKEEWSNTEYREWHLGHLHKKRRGLTFDTEEYSGVRVRWMPSIVPIDAWHAQKGYMHQASAESLLWHPGEGNVGSAIVNLGIGVE